MSFQKELAKWQKETGAHGNLAYTRFVLLKFAEGLSDSSSNKYILKGGNLLWLYIKTPRPTIDLDLTTEQRISKQEVLDDISKINIPFVKFKVKSCEEKIKENSTGLGIVISYNVESGSSSTFPIDIVLGVNSETTEIKALIKYLKSATLENIVVDKISACHSFGGGNTRMKDFDDLYRIVIEDDDRINPKALIVLANKRRVNLSLENKWINEAVEESWNRYLSNKAYAKKSGDLPKDLFELFEIVNEYLRNVKKIAQSK